MSMIHRTFFYKVPGIAISTVVQVQTRTVTATAYGIQSSNAASVHYANGTWEGVSSGDFGSGAGSYPWLITGAAADYDVRATFTGGTTVPTFSAGWANNTWARLNADRTFRLARSVTGVITCDMTVSIKYNANSTIVVSNTHSLSAEAGK